MENERKNHVAFKMENYLYVAGGCNGGIYLDSCERYDLKKNEWLVYQHSLSKTLEGAHSAVSADESFAVITGGLYDVEYLHPTNNIIIFTEQNGLNQCILRKRLINQ